MSKNILKSSAPLRVGTAGSNPASAQNGTIYYNTTDNEFRIYENGQWQDLATKAHVQAVELDDLYNVALASEGSGDVLVFNGTNWVNDGSLHSSLVSHASDIGALQSDVGSLQTDVSNALADIGTLQTDVSGALADISTLQGDVSSLQSLGLDGLSDVILATAASNNLLQYNGTSWVNVAPASLRTSESDAGKVVMTDGSGFLHESFLQFDIDFGGHILSGVDEIQGAGTLELRPVDGVSIIASSASSATVLSVYGAVAQYDKDHNTEYVSEKVVAETALSGSTTAAISALGFDASTVKGAVIEYRMFDTTTNDCRVGVMKVAVTADGDDVSIADSYVETADLDVSWSASVSSGAVSISYTSGAGTKNFKAKVKFI